MNKMNFDQNNVILLIGKRGRATAAGHAGVPPGTCGIFDLEMKTSVIQSDNLCI